MRGGAFRQGRTTMFCKLLEFLIEHAPTESIKAKLQAVYDEHCGGVTTQDDGGTGDPTPPPKN
jgi:hypothetical protein